MNEDTLADYINKLSEMKSFIKGNLSGQDVSELNDLIALLVSTSPNLLSALPTKIQENNLMNNSIPLTESSPLQDNDQTIAASFVNSKVSCVHHTSHTMLNANPDYKFANTAGVDACSQEVRIAQSDPTKFLSCEFSSHNFRCPMFTPSYAIVNKVEANSISYYLTRYRLQSGAYSYKVYDSTYQLYNELSYDGLSAKEYDMDSEANKVFLDFMCDMRIEYSQSEIQVNNIVDKKTKSSYLKTLTA